MLLPVGDIDRSVEFYRDKVGFILDYDTCDEEVREVQLTPEGSLCSIVFADLRTRQEMEPGSVKGLHVYVDDIETAHTELITRGVDAGEIVSFGEHGCSRFFGFADPDGNSWTVNQMAWRDKQFISVEAFRG